MMLDSPLWKELLLCQAARLVDVLVEVPKLGLNLQKGGNEKHALT